MQELKVAIIGAGYVGKAYLKLFPKAYVYTRHIGTREEVNKCDLAIICVPTPMLSDGRCDISKVNEIVGWLETDLILIKSTIPPGTTSVLKQITGKRICHSPEYVGEGGYFIPFWKYAHPTEPIYHDFMIIGGDKQDREDILQIFYPVLGATKTYYMVDETTSEFIKYMENAFIATKVTYSNEMSKMAKYFGVSYSEAREGFILDKRVGEMFTLVYKNRLGFDGKCLPKDMNAIIQASKKVGYEPKFLEAVLENNERLRNE